VLETIFTLARVVPRAETEGEIFRGHPLAVAPTRAATVFYGLWPALLGIAALFMRWRQS
jgi:hypothetical protein